MMTRSHLRSVAVLIGIVAACSSGCNIFDDDDGGGTSNVTTVFGSGVVIEETRNVGGFAGVDFLSEGSVRIERTGAESLLVRAEDNLCPYLVSNVSGGMLNLSTGQYVQLEPSRPIEFEVTAATLESVVLRGVGGVLAIGVTANRPRLTMSGVGTLEASNLQGSELTATNSGTGDIIASGAVDRQRVVLSGLGDYEGQGLDSLEADVTISGRGDVTVKVSNRLSVTISGSGNVYYIGSPSVTQVITGNGRVVQLSP